MTSTPGGTGIEPWWTYEERAIPGIGKALLNVGTGNLVVSAVDVDVHEAGIDLAFQRVYNSQSLHDYNGDDGGDRAIFGNLWTNNFDANIVYNQAANTFTVYDIDGTACTYSSDGKGNWDPCTGEHATFAPTDSTDCTYAWTKTNGTVYWFHADNSGGQSCSISDAKKGHLQEILGRNLNNNITFTYSYNGSGQGSEDVTKIVATHSDGHTLVMTFGLIPGTSINELASITRPNGTSTLQYSYDSSGNLLEVQRPGNDFKSMLPETYAYVPGTSYLQEACGPRCTVSTPQSGNPTDGSALLFTYNSSNLLNGWQVYGILNIDPNDGYGVIQPWTQKGRTWEEAYSANFVYGNGSKCTGTSSGTTTMCDSDGHSTIWSIDSSSRITQTQESTGSIMLVMQETWDAYNNLVKTIDANNHETDYAYANGDTIAVARPRPASGQDRPTFLYAYDSNHNLLSYCDPVYSSQNGLDWNSGPYTGSGCPGGPGTTHYQWKAPTDGSEPFGRIYQAFTACYNASCADHFNGITEPGLRVTYTYTSQGLPQTATGETIQQPGGSRTPTQTFGYDSFGNLTSYSNGGGTWILNYDSLNRLTSRVDPDTGNPTSYFYYNPDGSLSLTETPYQHSVSKGHAFTHDADGDVLTQTVHRNGTTGTIIRAYDGLDRLVEVQQPHSATYDVFANPWITRYIYDLTQGGTVSFNSSTYFSAYGNLYATQELLLSNGTSETYTGTPIANGTFQPLKGTEYDALDRAVGGYTIVNGVNELATTTYDGSGEAGLVSKQCQPIQTLCKNFLYDNDNRVTSITYTDPSSSTRTFTYDPAGHRLTATNGDGTQTFWYDLEGRVVNSKEPNHGTSPATYTHEFYDDGKLKQLDVSSNALTDNGLFAYSYTTAGQLGAETITYTPQNVNVTASFTYTPAGRLSQRSETGSGSQSSPTTMAYGNYGQLNAATYPSQNTIQNYQYNPEGDLLSFGTQNNGPYQTFSYTIRGDVLPASAPVGWNPLFGNPGTFAIANGAQVQTAAGTGILDFSATWDDRMGVMQSMNINPNTYPRTTTTFTYDAAGRESSNGSNYASDASGSTSVVTGSSRTYDVDNHTLDTKQTWQSTGQNFSYASANVSVYDWGPSDHPIRIGSADSTTSTPPPDSAATFDTLHWDGDQLVFSTNSSGQVDDIKVGTSGDITPLDAVWQGITFWDRGPGGAVVYCHNHSGSTGTGQIPVLPSTMTSGSSPCSNAFNQPPTGKSPTSIEWFTGPATFGVYSGKPRSGGIGQGAIIGMYRPDGISDGANTIQGVRTTDTASGTWTTPDAFGGIVDDPSSQKSYVWSGNNPMKYQDPAGYAIGQMGAGHVFDSGSWGSNWPAQAPDDGSSVAAASNAGAPGAACAATDQSGTCYQDQQVIIAPQGTKTDGFADINAAAKAAQEAYSFIITQGEVGCAVFCHGSNCGFGNATVTYRDAGGEANLLIDYSGVKGPSEVGVWHRHPTGDTIDFMMGHLTTAQDWFQHHRDGPPSFYVFTTQDKTLYVQQYQFGSGDVLPSKVP